MKHNRTGILPLALGAGIWLGAVALGRPGFLERAPGLIELLLLAYVLIIAPLWLGLLGTNCSRQTGQPFLPLRVARALHFPAALGVLGSFYVQAGTTALLLTLPWLLFSVALTWLGVYRFWVRSRGPVGSLRLSETCIDAGLVYHTVGACWLSAARFAMQPMGFPTVIVILTAVHFHYAGFTANMISGFVGRSLLEHARRRLLAPRERVYAFVSFMTITGPIVTAVGITWSPGLEVAAATLLALAMTALGFLSLRVAFMVFKTRPARLLTGISASGIIVGMLAATIYAAGEFTGNQLLPIPVMVAVHGVCNAIAFSLAATLAFHIEAPHNSSPDPNPQGRPPLSQLRARGRVRPDFFQAHRLTASESDRPVRGLFDDWQAYHRPDFDPGQLGPTLRDFYINTADYGLNITATWETGFGLPGKLYKAISAFMGQMNFPTESGSLREEHMDSRIFRLSDEHDGRTGVRAWVRTYSKTQTNIYAAAYSEHVQGGERYMNVAFPYILGNMTSILRLVGLPLPGAKGPGLLLSTDRIVFEPQAGWLCAGDEGIYYAVAGFPLRLPFNEAIYVWEPEKNKSSAGQTSLCARHDMFLFGYKFLTLNYAIQRLTSSTA